MPKVWIQYVTFARDLEWMKYSLDSFKKYATGFAGIVIVVPTWDVEKFLPLERYGTKDCPVLIKNFLEYPGKGFVHHLAMKCYADVFCPEATYILHMDPDCLWCSRVTPRDYFDNGLPVMVIEHYDAVKTYHEGRYNWKKVTEEALKFDCPFETMCRHPSIYHSDTYRKLRDYMEKTHITPFYDFVIKQKNSFPQGFGEFNTLGSFALKMQGDEYFFIDRGNKGAAGDPEPKVWQGWSYTGVHSEKNRNEIQKILG